MTLADRSVEEFLNGVASSAVTPSAGAVAAVSAASGAALCEMVCIHTTGKESHADVEDDLRELADGLRSSRDRLLELAEADGRAVDDLVAGTRATADEGEAAQRLLVEIPLETAEVCGEVLDVAPEAIEKGTETASEDGLTGVLLTHAALRSSLRLVRANLEDVGDSAFVIEVEDRVGRLEAEAERALERNFSAGE